MPSNYTPGRTNFGLLPEPEGRSTSFITSAVVNGLILIVVIVVTLTAKKVVDDHKFENTELIFPVKQPPKIKIKIPPPPKMPDIPQPTPITFATQVIHVNKPETKPELKPIEMEAKVNMPAVKAAKPAVILAPQPKAAMTAAMPAQNNTVKASTKPVHMGETFGVTPNPNATRPATVAAIGNPYGGMNGPAVAPHGVVGSTGIGNGLHSGSNAGVVGRVASAGIPGASGASPTGGGGKVASVVMPATTAVTRAPTETPVAPSHTQVEVSIPRPAYTDEARQLKIEGTVVLRVTFYANGQIQVLSVIRGLGHGLDEQAKRAVQQGKIIRPATVNGKAMDSTTNISITFQMA